MKNGLALVNAYVILPGAMHFYERMTEEMAKRGVVLKLATNAQIFSFIDSKGNLSGTKPDVDFVLYLDKDLFASYMLEMKGLRLYNSARSIELCDDKMLTHLALANQGIKMPKTISGPLNYSTEENLDFLGNLEKELTFPFVTKENYGSLGRQVFLVNNHEELIKKERELGHSPHLYQEFISSSRGHDFRLIMVGGKYVTGMKRSSNNGDFRSNIGLGGHGEKVEMPKPYIEMAEKAAKILRLDYCGIDLLEGPSGEPILDEVNSNAFIEGVEKVTGVNVAGAYADYIIKTIY